MSASTAPTESADSTVPSSILIIGSGVFGLSTAYHLCTDPAYKDTAITVVDRQPFPTPDGSSIDTSRIIRPDYADPAYAALANEAQELWRREWGADGRYHQTGLCLTAEAGEEAYVTASLQNVRALLPGATDAEKGLKVLRSADEIAEAMRTDGGRSGSTGYVNWTSGWADAEAAMRHLHAKVVACNRVRFVTATVQRLLLDRESGTAKGALLADGRRLEAALTVVAAGAWTPSLVDLRGVAAATGQVLAYLPITAEEQRRYGDRPVLLNLSNGMFAIPPARQLLKIARHGYGYSNPVRIPHPEDPDAGPITVSLPYTHLSNPNPTTTTTTTKPTFRIPNEGHRACLAFLHTSHPTIAARCGLSPSNPNDLTTSPFTAFRICWYTDTPQGDFLIDHHPRWRGLFLATGGSGHAFKFLPVIGRDIVRILERRPRDPVLAAKWAWPAAGLVGGGGEGGEGEGVGEAGEGFTGDGSRGGARGMVLEREFARDARELGKL